MRNISWKAPGSKKEIYDCFVLVDDDKKIIIKVDCTCPNFSGIVIDKEGKARFIRNKRIKEFGKGFFNKYYAEPCKHLNIVAKPLIKMGYKLKIPNMEGTDKPTAELKKQLLERSGGICEKNYCNNTANKIHRIFPGYLGGKYSLENCSFICGDCHKLAHSGEFKHISG